MQSELILAVIGALLPPVIDFINKYVSSSAWRYVISLIISMIVGGIMAVIQNGADNVLADMGLVFAASQTVYKLIYEKSKLQTTIRG